METLYILTPYKENGNYYMLTQNKPKGFKNNFKRNINSKKKNKLIS